MAEIVFNDGGELVAIVVDATPEERHRASAMATEHEVERGVNISDHVRPERRVLTLEVVISDTPLRATSALGGSVRNVDLNLPGRTLRTGNPKRTGVASFDAAPTEERAASESKAAIFQPDEEPTRVRDTWAALLDARSRALLATITTNLETYESMCLTEAIVTRTAADGTWIKAELTFAEIRQVSTEFVDDPVPARPRDRRQESRGSQATEEAPPQLRSLARRAFDSVGALFGGG